LVLESQEAQETIGLTVMGAFDGVGGDMIVGNGNYDLPVETVSSGHIRIR